MRPPLLENPAGLDDPILWTARSLRSEHATFAALLFFALGIAFFGLGLWVLVEVPIARPSHDSVGFMAPVFAIVLGLGSFWVGLSGKGVKPPPAYALSTKHAFISRHGYPGVWDMYCSLDFERGLQIDFARGRVAVPVEKERKFDRGTVYFSNLSNTDVELLKRVFDDLKQPMRAGK